MNRAPAPSDPATVSSLRSSVLDKLTSVFIAIGLLSVCVNVVRNIQVDVSPWKLLPALAGLAIVGTLHLLRSRIPDNIRSMVVVAAFVLVGSNSIYEYGVSAPGVFLIPSGIILCWLLLGGRAAIAVFAASSILFAIAAVSIVMNGTDSDLVQRGATNRPLFWVNLLIVQVYVGGVLVMAIRSLVGSLLVERTTSLKAAERLDGILEGIRDAIVVVDANTGIVERANPAAERMFGLPAGNFRGSPLGAFVDPDKDWTDSRFSSQQSLAGTPSFRWQCTHAGGERFWTEVSVRELEELGRRLLIATFRDIEATVREERELDHLNRGLEELVDVRTEALEHSRVELEYIALAISDDLKRPLKQIRREARHLRESQASRLDADGLQYLGRVESGVERMDVLIEALLGLSSIEDRPNIAVKVDMDRAARACCEELGNTRRKDATEFDRVVWEVSELPPCTTDAGLVGQVWANLLSNAFKFSAGKSSAFVRIRHIERPDGIWYEVSDNGIGFDMSQAGKLYKIFQRLHVDGPEGLGIGLATTRRILDRLGGEIEAEGRPGEGATFRFRPTAPIGAGEA